MNLRKDHYRLCLSALSQGFGSRELPSDAEGGGKAARPSPGAFVPPPVRSALPALSSLPLSLGPLVRTSAAPAAVVAAVAPARASGPSPFVPPPLRLRLLRRVVPCAGGRRGLRLRHSKSGPSPDRTGLPPFSPTGRRYLTACSLVPGADGAAGLLWGALGGSGWEPAPVRCTGFGPALGTITTKRGAAASLQAVLRAPFGYPTLLSPPEGGGGLKDSCPRALTGTRDGAPGGSCRLPSEPKPCL